MSDATPRFTRLDRATRRAQILDCARRLFGERTYAAVSMEDIAVAAGVRRGLLHHYFGSKRELFLEVVRELAFQPALPRPGDRAGSVEDAVDRNVGRWLDFVERNTDMWFAYAGAAGFGRDPEVERIVDEAREAIVDRAAAVVGVDAPSEPLRAALRAYASITEVVTREWLQLGRLTRSQAHALLSSSLLAMARDVAPAVAAA